MDRNHSITNSGKNHDDVQKGEVALWKAVITQALMDAGSESQKPEAKYFKYQAIAWLTGNSKDFNIVCNNADMSPSDVRKKAKAAIKRGCKWRNDGIERLKKKNKNKKYVTAFNNNSPATEIRTPAMVVNFR